MSVEKPLNKIIREKSGNKKFKVFVRDKSTGNVKTVRFGDASMKIRSNNASAKQKLMDRKLCHLLTGH